MRDVVAGALLTALAVWIWLQAGTYPSLPEGYPGPALFPRLIALGLGLSGFGLLLRGVLETRTRDETREPLSLDWRGTARLLAGAGLVALYPPVQGLIGFIPTVSLLIFGIAALLRVRLLVAAPTALVASVVIYWIFTGLLGVPL